MDTETPAQIRSARRRFLPLLGESTVNKPHLFLCRWSESASLQAISVTNEESEVGVPDGI